MCAQIIKTSTGYAVVYNSLQVRFLYLANAINYCTLMHFTIIAG